MGTSLTYWSREAASDGAFERVRSEAEELEYSWWAEGFAFFQDPMQLGRLYGDTKLFVMSAQTHTGSYEEIPPEDDSAMAWRDACFIVENLERWGIALGLNWQVSCAGAEVGTVINGKRDHELEQFLATFREIAELEEPVTSERIESILARFPTR